MALIIVEQGLSFVQYKADGVTTQYPLIFNYINKEHIKVFIGNTEVTYTWINASTITPVTAAVSDNIVTVRRFTPNTARLVDFQDGGQLSEALLDKDSTQMFYLAQESADTVNFNLTLDPLLQVVDFRSNRGINLATPINPTDAANKDYVNNELAAIQSSVASAVSTANAASASAVVAANDAAAAAASAAAVEGIAQSAVNTVTAHISNTTDAHDASAISVVASNGMVSTQVQAALDEHQGDINTISGNVSNLDTALAGHLSNTSPHATIIGSSIQTPSRLDVKQGTEAALITYATTASNGQIVFATDSKELFQIIDGGLAPIGAGGISLWVTAEPYEVNDVVIESDKIYRCIVLHTSGTFATDLAANKWTEVSSLPQALAPTDSPKFVDVELTGKLLSAVVQATSSAGVQIKNAVGTTVLDVGPANSTNSSFVGSVNVGGNVDVTGNINALNYQNQNLLINPNFEGTSITDWTCTGNTCTRTTTANEYLIGSAALKVVLGGNVLDVKQTVTTNAAQLSGVQMVASIWVKSDDVSDIQLCSMKNGSEDKCTVTGGYVQGSGWRQLTVSFLGDSTSNGLKLKSTDTTGTVLVDQAYVGIGSPVVDFTPDMVYSAKLLQASGSVSSENTDFITTCTSGVNPMVCTFVTGVFTVAPNCSATPNYANVVVTAIQAVSTTSVSIGYYSATTGAALTNGEAIITCKKTGADYKTSKAYVASSSDTDWASCGHTTSDFTGFGTVTGIETQCKREGSDLLMRGKFTSGVSTAVEARINLKLNNSLLTSQTSSTIPTLQIAGYGNLSAATGNQYNILIEPSVGYITLGMQNATNSGQTKQQGSTIISSGQALSFFARIPIQGWTDSGVIVGSFQDVPTMFGAGAVKIYDIVFGGSCVGTSGSASACSSGTCAICSSTGLPSGVSVTNNGTGTYRIQGVDGSKTTCSGTGFGGALTVVYPSNNASNTSYFQFSTIGNAGTGLNSDNVSIRCSTRY